MAKRNSPRNGWDFLEGLINHLPGWPTERQMVTIALIGTLWIMLQMAVENPKLWDVKLFEILIQGFALTGMLNMVLAFHFSANKADETKTENTGKFADAFKEQAITARAALPEASTPDVTLQPGETAQAAPSDIDNAEVKS